MNIAVEEPLEIILKHGGENQVIEQVVSITMRTPGDDEDWRWDFFYRSDHSSESQVYEIHSGDDNKVVVKLHEDAVPSLHKADRNFYTTSSCGVCGKDQYRVY